ncbi:MAG: thioredoxin [Ignavibacteria bacterium]|nr:thioredoxin [Ignavibacteria bacterium]
MTIDVADFQTEVLDLSREMPVLVDFWAEWCGPCRTLGPILEKIADENEGSWALAKVDTERFPDISVQYGVRSIPNVKLFIDGKVADEFTGALPERAVRQWIEKAIPAKPAHNPELEQAELHLAQGDIDAAERLLGSVIAADPANTKARVLLAQIFLADDPAKAAELVAAIEPGSEYDDMVFAIRTIADLLRKDPNALPDAPVKDAYVAALGQLDAGDFDAALLSFIDVIRRDRYYDDDNSRKGCIAIFKLLGEEHEISLAHRKDFNRSLY